MEKKVLQFGKFEVRTIDIDGTEVEVMPFLTMEDELALINMYVKNHFFPEINNTEKSDWAYWDAERALKLGVIDLKTSIQIEGTEFENFFYSPNIWEKITDSINNYWDFREILDQTVNDIKKQLAMKNSVGAKLDSLFDKIEVLLNSLQESMANLNPEMLDKLKETGSALIDKLSENPIAKEVLADSSRGK
jgi:RNAse (barnase) inhibitor barstar